MPKHRRTIRLSYKKKMETTILNCKNLYKKLGKKEILKDVSVSLEQGDILGFIGPNGARKNHYNQTNIGIARNR